MAGFQKILDSEMKIIIINYNISFRKNIKNLQKFYTHQNIFELRKIFCEFLTQNFSPSSKKIFIHQIKAPLIPEDILSLFFLAINSQPTFINPHLKACQKLINYSISKILRI